MFGAETAPPDPPGAVATRAHGLRNATQERRVGGPGGRNAGMRAPEESEHAHHPGTEADHLTRVIIAGGGAAVYGAELKASNQERRPQRPRPACERKPQKVRGSVQHLFCTQSAQSAFARVPHQVTPEKSARPSSDYNATFGECILFLIHWQH